MSGSCHARHQTVFLTSAIFSLRRAHVLDPGAQARGPYTVRLAATDLAGNFNRIAGSGSGLALSA